MNDNRPNPFPYQNPSNDPVKGAFWERAAQDLHRRVTSVPKLHETPMPPDYWDRRRALKAKRMDIE